MTVKAINNQKAKSWCTRTHNKILSFYKERPIASSIASGIAMGAAVIPLSMALRAWGAKGSNPNNQNLNNQDSDPLNKTWRILRNALTTSFSMAIVGAAAGALSAKGKGSSLQKQRAKRFAIEGGALGGIVGAIS